MGCLERGRGYFQISLGGVNLSCYEQMQLQMQIHKLFIFTTEIFIFIQVVKDENVWMTVDEQNSV